MINNNEIYHNPLIPPHFYFAKIIYVEAEPSDFYYPKTLIKLCLHSGYGITSEIILTSIIHPTHNSQEHFEKFAHTYLCYDENDIGKAIGRWGSIWVYDAEYNETKYSMVKFVWQPFWVQIMNIGIYEKERVGDMM